MPSLTVDLEHQGLAVDHLLIDRGYINSPLVDAVLARRGTIVCKPWTSRNGSLFPKSAFTLNIRARTIECPNGQVQGFSLGTVVEFDSDVCDHCSLRAQCTTAELGNGRSVAIAENEQLQQRLRKQIRTRAGREALRERTTIEHKLAHILATARQSRALHGHPQECLRPPARERDPKSGDTPSVRIFAKDCVMTLLSNRSPL